MQLLLCCCSKPFCLSLPREPQNPQKIRPAAAAAAAAATAAAAEGTAAAAEGTAAAAAAEADTQLKAQNTNPLIRASSVCTIAVELQTLNPKP